MRFGGLGGPELVVIIVLVILIFGPKQLPKLGQSIGQTIREFRGVRKEITALHDEE